MLIYLKNKNPLNLFIPCLLLIGACSGTKPEDVPSTADPYDEITKLDQDRNAALQEHVDILSPVNFQRSTDALQDAKEKRDKGRSHDSILGSITKSRSNLRKAHEAANRAHPALSEVLKARNDALKADAPQYARKEFSDTEAELMSVTKKIESGDDVSYAEKNRSRLLARYLDAELYSLKEKKLGPARDVMNQALREDAKKYAPKTLLYTESVINNADSFITVDRHNELEIDKKSAQALASAQRLLKMTRESKVAGRKDSEQLLLEAEAKVQRATQDAQVAANEMIQSESVSKARYEMARRTFTPEEAEVYLEGDRLLIRLKQFNFPVGKGYILPENYALLNKVRAVLQNVGQSQVTVEGHSDSTGTKAVNRKLSQSRAGAIKDYLVANQVVPESKVKAVGYGFSKPLASNKTKAGRDTNRRIDLIIDPET